MEEKTEKEHISNHVDIETKRFFFDVKENHKGQYLRITELSGGRSSIVVPLEGVEMFRDKLVETIKQSLEVTEN